MPATSCNHPIETPVRHTPLKIGTTTATHIAQMDSPYLLDLRWMNGAPFIHLGGSSNHRSSPDVVELFEHVAVVAPGSYGLLHVHDDEEPDRENEVRVLRLVRGRVTQHTEALLSPYIPTVEDPSTG
ncbi:Imm7 family immunity protein [Streptomyces fagopyri]|uniref:Imm7 family immunity protein n=1 Tax=Streptomyces fagopyri TaxID=2662397 RepID=UPI0038251716